MSKCLKRAIAISIIVILIILVIISTFFIVKYINNKSKIEYVEEIYSDDNVQNRINENEDNPNDLILQIDGENVLGVIKIDKIGFEGLVYEGTSLSTLAKGVGHFEDSPYLNGNVCFAAHNTNKFWAKLHTLQQGDKITYTSFLGTKEYVVVSSMQIDETDWNNLKNTEENMLTLITCVKGNKPKRLCVQAIEVN